MPCFTKSIKVGTACRLGETPELNLEFVEYMIGKKETRV